MTTNKPTLPVSGYAVFVYNNDIGAYAPQFNNIEVAEEFANAIRLATDLTVSEPVPVIATHTNKKTIEAARSLYSEGFCAEDHMG